MAELIKTQKAPQRDKAAQQKQPDKRGKPDMHPQQIVDAPDTLRSEEVLTAQQRIGNQAVQRALDDNSRRKGVESISDASGNLRDDISSAIQAERGNGSPLPKEVQSEAKRTLGHNFDNVRIHTDAKADSLSRSIQARAFTIGSDIFFKGGVFSPNSKAGRETLIHELTHVVQQSGTHSGGRLKLGPVGNAMEREADHMGKKAASSVQGKSAGSVQRWSEEEEVQTQEDEEEIQTQPEAASIQRAPEDEEEIQTQPEAASIQRAPEDEEEIQTQPEAASIQRAPEDEEEIQTQPEPGTVQRLFGFSGFKKKFSSLFSSSQEEEAPLGPKPTTAPPIPGLGPKPTTPAPEPSLTDQIGPKPSRPAPVPRKPVIGGSRTPTVVPAVPKAPFLPGMTPKDKPSSSGLDFATELKMRAQGFKAKHDSEGIKDPAKDPVRGLSGEANQKQVDFKMQLIAKIENPSTSSKDAEEAEEQFKDMFGKKQLEEIKKRRKSNLMNAARSGNKEAYETYKSEHSLIGKAKFLYGKHKSKIDTVLPLLKEHGPSILSGLKGALGSGGNASSGGASQVVNINGGGGGGAAGPGGGMMEIMNEYARLKAENEALKKQLQEKQPAQ